MSTPQYLLITYSWYHIDTPIFANMVWDHSIGDWMMMIENMPNRWVLMNSVQISKSEYDKIEPSVNYYFRQIQESLNL